MNFYIILTCFVLYFGFDQIVESTDSLPDINTYIFFGGSDKYSNDTGGNMIFGSVGSKDSVLFCKVIKLFKYICMYIIYS